MTSLSRTCGTESLHLSGFTSFDDATASPPPAQVPRNRRLTETLLCQRPNLCSIIGFGAWSPMRLPTWLMLDSGVLHTLYRT